MGHDAILNCFNQYNLKCNKMYTKSIQVSHNLTFLLLCLHDPVKCLLMTFKALLLAKLMTFNAPQSPE